MEFLTSNEIAYKWNISTRRVTTLYKDGRIEGAVQKGGVFGLIPDNVQKPVSMKRGRKTSRGGDNGGK